MKIDYLLDWPEFVACIFFFIGIVIALASGSYWVLYTCAFLMGLLFGRVWYRQRVSNKVPLVFAMILFLFGMIIGSFFAWVRSVTILLFAGALIAYFLHKKGFVESVEF
ncbi:MAG TPA: hypothetical protein VJJ82_01470 [Candidatus Nanoarchaeia archaeon]|nr:hypothetical protein [Candidatus Nanoarchaeia archaeon]